MKAIAILVALLVAAAAHAGAGWTHVADALPKDGAWVEARGITWLALGPWSPEPVPADFGRVRYHRGWQIDTVGPVRWRVTEWRPIQGRRP